MTSPVLWGCLLLSSIICAWGSSLPGHARHKREAHGEYSVVTEAGCGGSTVHIYYIDWTGVESSIQPPSATEVYTEFFPITDTVYKDKDALFVYLTSIVDATKAALAEDGSLTDGDWPYVFFQYYMTSDLFAIQDDYTYTWMTWVREFFTDSGRNPFHFYWDWVRILTADEEAAYWWLTLNYYRTDDYFLGADYTLPSPAQSYGILWQTRASAEIAFVPDGWILDGKNTMYFAGQGYPVFADGAMGYGLDYINVKVIENLATAQPGNNAITHPCMLQGDQLLIQHLDRPLKLTGSGNYDECVTQVDAVMQGATSATCEYTYCGLEGKYQPPVDGTTFYALGSYGQAFSALDVLGTDGKVDLTKFEANTRAFSQKTPSEVRSENMEMDADFVSKAYMMGVYAPRLFEAYGFQPDTAQIYSTRTNVGQPVAEISADAVENTNGLGLDWTVGAALYTLPRRDICVAK